MYTGPPTATASTTTPEPPDTSPPASTLPTPPSTDSVTRTDLGANYWDLSGAPVEAAHNPGQPRPVNTASKPTDVLRPTCPDGFVCGREPGTLSGSAAPSPFGACETTIQPPKHFGDAIRFSPGATTFERKVEPKACCYHWFTPCPGGRPLRDLASEAIVADVISRDGWTSARDAVASCADASATDLDDATGAVLAAHWAREAAFEHASVASFSVASLELLGLGAPADLVKGAHEAALDEIDHARRCFDLASAYAAAERGPAALPLAADLVARTPEAIARKTLLDACVNESIAALAASRAREDARDERVRETLAVIVADEARHAELGWRTLSWLVATFGDAALPVVRAEAESLREELARDVAGFAPGVDAASGDAWGHVLRAHGVLSADGIARVRREALAMIVLPCFDALLAGASPSREQAEALPISPA